VALLQRFRREAERSRPASLLLTGGVAANSLLRREAARMAEQIGRPLFVPPIALSTDNAAMIAAAGYVAFRRGVRAGWDLNAEPHLPLETLPSSA
jgi:N6-L-threonylcarbamoyladenine synthase